MTSGRELTGRRTADHDIDDESNTQITLYAGRGFCTFFSFSFSFSFSVLPLIPVANETNPDVESTNGPLWLWGTGSEHFVLYQYQFANTKNIFMGQIQTETPYYQPTPNALVPFTPNTSLNDPDFSASCAGVDGNCAAAWGLRILDSSDVLVYGGGLYSFFSDYSTSCSTFDAGQTCQQRIASIEGSVSNVGLYNLNTIGTIEMINRDGKKVAGFKENENTFASNVAVYKAA